MCWIPAFAGMTVVGGNDSLWAGMAVGGWLAWRGLVAIGGGLWYYGWAGRVGGVTAGCGGCG